jgi:hypothetical protein
LVDVAESVVDPLATPVAVVVTDVPPAGIVTELGTVAIAVLRVLRLMTAPPLGAGVVTVTTKFTVPPGGTRIDAGRTIWPRAMVWIVAAVTVPL